MRESNEFKYYGLLPVLPKEQIKLLIAQTVAVLGNGSNDNADTLLYETVGIETHFATAKDHSAEYGEGLGQFDRIGFDDVKARTSAKNKARVRDNLGIDIDSVRYEDLRSSPLVSIVFIRLKFLLVPGQIPIDTKQRYDYYKKWYNSIYGASTWAKFANANGYQVA